MRTSEFALIDYYSCSSLIEPKYNGIKPYVTGFILDI